jgi:uncharacterized protein (TIGR00369 family)
VSQAKSEPKSPPKISIAEFEELVRTHMPITRMFPAELLLLEDGVARIRMPEHEVMRRAGGIVNGPMIMTLADMALYAAVLSRVGLEAMAVTVDLSVRFLRPAPMGAIVADACLIRAGRRLAIGEITITSEVTGKAVAHATGSYALPS